MLLPNFKSFCSKLISLTVLCALVGLTVIIPIFAQSQSSTTSSVKTDPIPSEVFRLEHTNDLEPFLDQFMEKKMAEKHIPGAVLSIVKDGKLLFAKGYGYSDLEHQIPVQADRTLFRVASVSKLFASTAAMQLVERGMLDLNADIRQVLDLFPVPSDFTEPITLHHLLTHTAGYDETAFRARANNAEEVTTLRTAKNPFVQSPVRAPGERLSYSNYGMELVGFMVEKQTGQTFEQYVRQNIFEPLGMESSTFSQSLPKDMTDRLAIGYRWKQGTNLPQSFNYFHGGSSGSLITNAIDVSKFMIAHLQNEVGDKSRILQPKTVELMHRQHYTIHPQAEGMAYGFFEDFNNGRRALSHHGRLSEAQSILYLLPEEEIGLFVSYNLHFLDERGNSLGQQIIDAFMDRYFPASAPDQPHPTFTLSKQEQTRLAGTYRWVFHSYNTAEKILSLLWDMNIRFDKNGKMISDSFLQGHSVLEATGKDVFVSADGKKKLSFLLIDNQGKADYVHIDGDIAAYERVSWFETSNVQFVLFGWFLFLFATVAIAGFVTWLKNLFGGKRSKNISILYGYAVIGAGNLIYAGLIVLLVLIPLSDNYWGPLGFGVSWKLQATGFIPWITAASTFVILYRTWKMFKQHSIGIPTLVYSLLIATHTCSFAALVWYWNLVAGLLS
ncbi:beta-lactamase family protein [Paenibacillus sp. GSMTC-2017]|uniref:serine hydrolase domain-containing protein n=1 Tax=Paenibacillus sp. GSMTC-2017 TaxID=2794350 RepID=UPI0018D91D9F|nr:serine hydrolase domain-containing protein [Paenibacillus sp. GSMTC-2017]MBH5317872.1 beta-lactamase family protein [Paenibacillus sp. GSMTC-2017]